MNIPFWSASPLFVLALSLVLTSFGISAHSASAQIPPTVDPTYNLPHNAPVWRVDDGNCPCSWIWADKTAPMQTVYFRKDFNLDSLPKSVHLFIVANDNYALSINCKLADQTQSPASGKEPEDNVHNIDITQFLTPGRNVICVQEANTAKGAGLLALVVLDDKVLSGTDGSWRVYAGPTPPTGWSQASYDDSSWSPAMVLASYDEGHFSIRANMSDWPYVTNYTVPHLSHVTLPFAAVVSSDPGSAKIAGLDALPGSLNDVITVAPAISSVDSQSSIVLDFGKEIAGRVLIQPLTSGTATVAIGESLDEAEKTPYVHPQTLTLIKGLTNGTVYSAFRYVVLSFPPESSPLSFRIAVDHKYYPVTYRGSFDCSDPLLTKIWYTGAYTAHLCMQEDIWDAPKRDRMRWVGDLHVSGEIINNVFADKFLMEQTLNRLIEDSHGKDVNGIPGYSCAWICCLADFHRHIGDYAFLDSQHARLLTLLAHLQADLDARGVFVKSNGSWMYVDWSPGFFGDDAMTEATTHMFFTKAVTESVFLLREMGDNANADKYAQLADALKAAGRQYLPDPATNTYSNRLQENAMAIYSGVATPAQDEAIYSAVLNPTSPSWNRDGKLLGDKPVMTPYYGNYIIKAMSMAGHTDAALQIVRDWWGGMLAEGATTFWEGYDPNWPKAHFHDFLQADNITGTRISLCHGWSAGPTNFLTERVLGVQPTGAGFKTVSIAPDLADLTWAEGNVPTPRGTLHVRADVDGSSLKVSVNVPRGVIASVSIPGSAVTVNGKPVSTNSTGDGRVTVLLTKKGSYTIKP